MRDTGSSPATAQEMLVDVSYAALQAHRIANVALHQEYSPGIIFIFSQGRKHLYPVQDYAEVTLTGVNRHTN
jgi:hypothetical protein